MPLPQPLGGPSLKGKECLNSLTPLTTEGVINLPMADARPMFDIAPASDRVSIDKPDHCMQQLFGLRDRDVALGTDRTHVAIPIVTDDPNGAASAAVVLNFARTLRAVLCLRRLSTPRDLRGWVVGLLNLAAPPRPLDRVADPRRHSCATHLLSMWI